MRKEIIIVPFAIAIFIGAFLLFQIQPMIAKMILPWFGGSAAVWITCMVFFSFYCFAGIFTLIFLTKIFTLKPQTIIHLILLIISLFLLPVKPLVKFISNSHDMPVREIIKLLTLSLGLPYFLLSTTSPLMQSWYSYVRQEAFPYRLFSLSNGASLLGLLAYPFIIEPYLSLKIQSYLWFFYMLCFVLQLLL